MRLPEHRLILPLNRRAGSDHGRIRSGEKAEQHPATGAKAAALQSQDRMESVANPHWVILETQTAPAPKAPAHAASAPSQNLGDDDAVREILRVLEQVWTIVEKDMEANLLIFLEKLFVLEPCAVIPLRSLERRHLGKSSNAEQDPSLSVRIRVIAKHFGLAVRSGADGSALPHCALRRGFRSLARSLADQGWGHDFLTSIGSAVALALASVFGERWMPMRDDAGPGLAQSWW